MKFLFGIAMLALALSLPLSGCGGSEESTPAKAGAARNIARESPPEVAHAADWGELKKFAGSRAGKLLIPHGPAPQEVVIRDLKRGTGRVMVPNHFFVAHYVSFAFYNGQKIESEAWSRTRMRLPWNIKETVNAWWPGLKGMREGGIRELIAPSFWAYNHGALVYIVKLVKVEEDELEPH